VGIEPEHATMHRAGQDFFEAIDSAAGTQHIVVE
jgi:hypothetical protein